MPLDNNVDEVAVTAYLTTGPLIDSVKLKDFTNIKSSLGSPVAIELHSSIDRLIFSSQNLSSSVGSI